MGILDKIIKENLEGEIFYDGWIKCKHVQRGLTHCKECLSVDNCWFYSLKNRNFLIMKNVIVIMKQFPFLQQKIVCSL